jgi:AcrR family transcriptional regulator
VLEVAAKLIAAHGYAATSIARIGRESGANPASIYWAFGSKEGLFAAVMERAAAAFFAGLSDLQGEVDDPWQGLADLGRAFEGGPEFLRLLLVLSLERRDGDPAALDAARRVRADAVARLAKAYAVALPVTDDPQRRTICETLARYTLMLFDGVFVASQIEPDSTDMNRAFELIATGVRATGERLVAQARSAS